MSTALDTTVIVQNPFPGLRTFSSEEKNLFFGRERQLDELLRKLRTSRFLAVVGTGGSGKSSLVRASLVPRLLEGFSGQGGDRWRIAVCTPGKNPIESLSKSLAQRGVLHPDDIMDPNFPAVVENTLRRGSYGIVEAFKQAGIKENLMVVVDQFEEVFQTGPKKKGRKNKDKEGESAAFVNLLLSACRQKDVPIYIVLTLRSSHLGMCTEFRGLPETINDGQFLIPRMKTEDLKRAIIAPIESPDSKKYHKAETTIDRELTGRIINDLGEDIDQLSVLQHALMRMWCNWELRNDGNLSAPITATHYEAVGGVKDAMSRHAQEAYDELTGTKRDPQTGKIAERDEAKVAICQKMFRALSEKGADGRPARRAVSVKELMRITEANLSDVRIAIYMFSREDRLFLAAPPLAELDEDSMITIAHESLMERWELLRQWMDEESEAADIYARMAAAAALYYEGKGGLWSDPELSMGLNWYNKEHPNAAWAERYNPAFFETIEFLKESEKKHTDAIAVNKEEVVRREKRNSLFAIGGVLIAIIAFLLLGLSWVSLNRANRSAREARRSAMEAQRQTYLASLNKQDADRERFEATKQATLANAEREKAQEAANAAILSSNYADKQRIEALNQKQLAQDALLEAEKEKENALKAQALAEASKKEAQEKTKEALEAQRRADEAKGLSLAQSVAVKSQELEDVITRSLLAKEAHSLNKDNNGKPYDPFIYKGLYTAMNELQAKKGVGNNGVNPNFNALNQTPPGYDRIGAVRAMRMSKDDKTLYTTGSEGFLLAWEMPAKYYVNQKDRNAHLPVELAKPQSKVYRALDISPDGKFLARGGDNSKVEIYDLKGGQLYKEANPHKGYRVWSIVFMPDGRGFVSSGGDGSIQYTTTNGESAPIVAQLPEEMNRVTSMAISSDGRFLAGTGTSSGVWIWNNETGQVFKKLVVAEDDQAGRVATSVAFGGKDNSFVAVGFEDGTLRIWHLNDYDEVAGEIRVPKLFKYHTAKISDLEFSKDGKFLAVGSLDKSATLWRIKGDKSDFPYKDPKFIPIRLDDHKSWVMSVTFTNNGDKMITGCQDGVIKYWETDMSFYAEEICQIAASNLSDGHWEAYIGTDDPTKKQLYIKTAKGSGFERMPLRTCLDMVSNTPYPQEGE